MENINSGKSLTQERSRAMQILLCLLPVVSYSATVHADESKEAQRINTITVYGQPVSSDSDTIVAEELWVGGKVATNVLDTPALVSVITEKEINQRNATTTEEILQYSPGLVTDYYGTDDRNISFFLLISLIVLTFVIFSFEFVATRFFVLFGPF